MRKVREASLGTRELGMTEDIGNPAAKDLIESLFDRQGAMAILSTVTVPARIVTLPCIVV